MERAFGTGSPCVCLYGYSRDAESNAVLSYIPKSFNFTEVG